MGLARNMNWAMKHQIRLGLCLFLISGATPAFAQQPKDANQVTRVAPNTNSRLTSSRSVLGSFEVIGVGGAGNVTIWDSPDGTPTHAQAVVIAEGGVTAEKGSFASGTINRMAQYGIYVETNGCQAVVQYGT